MKQFILATDQIAEEKGIPMEKIMETVERAIAAAYKKDYGEKGQIVKAKLNTKTGDLDLKQIKYVIEGVDEEGYITGKLPHRPEDEGQALAESKKDNEKKESKDIKKEKNKEPRDITEEGEELKMKYNLEKHILLEDARKIDKKINIGDELITPLETKTDFGRVAAQTAKQVIVQQLREVERDVIYEDFKNKEGEIISGTIQRREGLILFVDLGRINGILVPAEQIQNDNYHIGQRLRLLIVRVEKTTRGPAVILSRSHPKLIQKLFELEVPEIETNAVEIKGVARESGSRSKVAVTSNEEGVDPIGSLVGQRGVRVQTVINELSGEKVDIVEWSDDIKKFITNALSPAKILNVKIVSEKNKHALAEVVDDQFSLAIGKRGQNVRLAAKLTGWKIDVRSPMEKMSAKESEVEKSDEKSQKKDTKKDKTSESPASEKKEDTKEGKKTKKEPKDEKGKEKKSK